MSKFPRVIFITLLALSSALGGFFIIRTLDRHFSHSETSSTSESASSSNNGSPTSTPNSSSTSDPVEKPVENSSTEADSTDVLDSSATNPKTPVQYESEGSAAPSTLTAYFSTMRLDNSRLTLRVNIDQYLSSGSCHLLVADAEGKHIIERTAEILPVASTSTCAGFDLTPANFNLDSFAALAKPLSLELSFTSGNESGILRASLE